MSQHESAGPLRACVKVADYCDPSSAGTLTCVKSLEMCVESAFATVSKRNSRSFLFILVMTIRMCCIIELPNPISKTAILKIVILAKFRNRFWVSKPIDESDFRQSAKAPHKSCL
jgi:hypothetical protein